VANSKQHSTSTLGVSSGRLRQFSPLHVTSSSSTWFQVCVNSVSFHPVQALRNYRPLRPGRFILIILYNRESFSSVQTTQTLSFNMNPVWIKARALTHTHTPTYSCSENKNNKLRL
jgi:hypothetical protein